MYDGSLCIFPRIFYPFRTSANAASKPSEARDEICLALDDPVKIASIDVLASIILRNQHQVIANATVITFEVVASNHLEVQSVIVSNHVQ